MLNGLPFPAAAGSSRQLQQERQHARELLHLPRRPCRRQVRDLHEQPRRLCGVSRLVCSVQDLLALQVRHLWIRRVPGETLEHAQGLVPSAGGLGADTGALIMGVVSIQRGSLRCSRGLC